MPVAAAEVYVKLDQWRRAAGLSYSDLGRNLGVSPEAARRYCNERRMPRPAVLQRIRDLTRGAVTANDFLPPPPPPPKGGSPDDLL